MRLINTRICDSIEAINKTIRMINDNSMVNNGKIEKIEPWVNENNGKEFTVITYSYEVE